MKRNFKNVETLAASSLFIQYCGETYSGVCEAYRTSTNRGARLMQMLDKVSFEDVTRAEEMFSLSQLPGFIIARGDGSKVS